MRGNWLQTFNCALTVDLQIRSSWITFSVHRENKKMLCKRRTENDLHGAPDSYVHWLCHTTTESLDMGVDYIYSFKPNKTLQAELNVDLFQNGKD